MSFDAEKEWKYAQIAMYSRNLFEEMTKDRQPNECLAISTALTVMIMASCGCTVEAMNEYRVKNMKLLDEAFIKSGGKK